MSYDILIQEGWHEKLIPYSGRSVIITDENVQALYGNALKAHVNAEMIVIPAGEIHKTRETKEYIEDELFRMKKGKDVTLMALGGGVVMDMTGFCASTYMRGVSFVMLPTTLLGMVDACIGGKNGVNTPFGKNLIGSIYRPEKVFINTGTLNTLPEKEWKNGLVEMIKHALILDSSYYDFLMNHSERIQAKDPIFVKEAVQISCRLKKQVVEEDERETGKRRILNFGHTVGHAIESVSNYTISHGEAVAFGIMAESYIAEDVFHFSAADKVAALFEAYGINFSLPGFKMDVDAVLERMVYDKKNRDNGIRFVIIKEIGAADSFHEVYCTPIDKAIVKKALERVTYDLCCR